MTDEELLHRMAYNEVKEIKHGLQDKLEMCLYKNGLGIRLAKVQIKGERLWINQEYNVEFVLKLMPLEQLDTDAMRRLSNVLNEMRAEFESVNNEYKGFTFVF